MFGHIYIEDTIIHSVDCDHISYCYLYIYIDQDICKYKSYQSLNLYHSIILYEYHGYKYIIYIYIVYRPKRIYKNIRK